MPVPRVFHVPTGDRTWRVRSRDRETAGEREAVWEPRGDQGPLGAGSGIVAGYLAPHPPHLVYAENPPQNEPRSQGGWEGLRWAYEDLRNRLRAHRADVIVIHAPHWITMVGHHVNCVPNPRGLSVEPIFPHLLRFRYDFRTDVELAEAIAEQAADLLNPDWDIPVVSLSANNNPYYYSTSSLEDMEILGVATRKAIEATGRRAVLAASNSLSHFHWDREPELPEDMAYEHPYDNHQYRWDMRLLELIRAGRTTELRRFIPEHIEATESETKAGSLTWLLAAMGWPEGLGEVLAYGSVIGTGNAVCAWEIASTASEEVQNAA